MKHARGILSVVALAVAGAGAANATSFLFNDFSSVAGLQLNGSAAQAGNVLRLTPSAVNQSGSAFSTSQTTLGTGASFSTYFTFRLSNNGGIGDGDGQGADGIAFIVQTVSNTAGGVGGGLGYQGISPSLGIEFDTFNNGGIDDNSNNHVGVDLNGSVDSVTTVNEPVRFNNAAVWNAWVDYNGTTNNLEVRWSLGNLRPLLAQITHSVDLDALLGQNSAFVGFSAGTGAGFNDQDILSWEFRDSFNPVGVAPVPGTLALLGLAALGLGFARRKK